MGAGRELLGVYERKLAFRDGLQFLFVSEYAYDAYIRVVDPGTGTAYEFKLESERTIMFAADREGLITATYRDDQVQIHATPNVQPLEAAQPKSFICIQDITGIMLLMYREVLFRASY